MPRKVRQLLADYRRAGFTIVVSGGKGSHRKAIHPLLPGSVTISGQDGDDADHYQERDLRNALRDLEKAKRRQP
jgi:predicted RNA binding protein YcfA (HicA-like mRNA interferase family)